MSESTETPNVPDTSDAEKKLTTYKMVIVGLVTLLIGGVLGAILFGGGTSSNGEVVASSEGAAVPETEVETSWSVEGQVAPNGNGGTETVVDFDTSAPLPQGVNPFETNDYIDFGWNYNERDESLPDAVVWADFQCPACSDWERNGSLDALAAKADNGELNLVVRPLAFLDANYGNDSSQRSTAAWGCAIDQGKALEYYKLVFLNQPQQGAGFRDEDLLFGAELVGLEGAALDEFTECYESGRYSKWAPTSSVESPQSIGGTPSVSFNETVLDIETIWDPSTLVPAVDELLGNG